MNKYKAKKIAMIISNDTIAEMLENAKKEIRDWTVRSQVNKGMTIGASWNVMQCWSFDPKKNLHIVLKTNMIWEFGDYLPSEFIQSFNGINKQELIDNPFHQEPKL